MTLTCDMRADCAERVTHIGRKGYVYCATHAPWRHGVETTRNMTKAEISILEAGGRDPLGPRQARSNSMTITSERHPAFSAASPVDEPIDIEEE